LSHAYEQWSGDIGSAYVALGVAKDFCDEILLLYAFGEKLGGTYSRERDSISIRKEKIPADVIRWSNSGIVRIQQTNNLIEIFFPYPFLVQYLKAKVSLIREADLSELLDDIRARWKDESKANGICFQLALGLELMAPTSKLVDTIITKIGGVHPAPYVAPLARFSSEDQVDDILNKNQIGISIDPNSNRKIGDIVFKVESLYEHRDSYSCRF
jgi:hypothetical protein